jgi:hypothetical protein
MARNQRKTRNEVKFYMFNAPPKLARMQADCINITAWISHPLGRGKNAAPILSC